MPFCERHNCDAEVCIKVHEMYDKIQPGKPEDCANFERWWNETYAKRVNTCKDIAWAAWLRGAEDLFVAINELKHYIEKEGPR
jgi:hypothetical protein